jgi:hypothetical protein
MTLWELASAFRSESSMVQKELDRTGYTDLAGWHRNLTEHIRHRNRIALDAVVPDDLCRRIASRSRMQFSLSSDGWLCVTGYLGAPDEVELLSALDVLVRYGGRCLEELQEYGSCRVDTPPTTDTH